MMMTLVAADMEVGESLEIQEGRMMMKVQVEKGEKVDTQDLDLQDIWKAHLRKLIPLEEGFALKPKKETESLTQKVYIRIYHL